jgi:hypothetical protein
VQTEDTDPDEAVEVAHHEGAGELEHVPTAPGEPSEEELSPPPPTTVPAAGPAPALKERDVATATATGHPSPDEPIAAPLTRPVASASVEGGTGSEPELVFDASELLASFSEIVERARALYRDWTQAWIQVWTAWF